MSKRSAFLLCVAIALVAGMCAGRLVASRVEPLALEGRLVATEADVDAGTFTLEHDEPITLSVASGSYIHDWLSGAVGHQVRLTIQPDPDAR